MTKLEISYTFCSFSFHSCNSLTALYMYCYSCNIIHQKSDYVELCYSYDRQLIRSVNVISFYRKWSLKLEVTVRVAVLKSGHFCFSPNNWWAIIFNFSIFSSGNTSCFQMIHSQVASYFANEWRNEAFVELRKIFSRRLRRNPHSNCKCAYYSNFLAVLQSVTKLLRHCTQIG